MKRFMVVTYDKKEYADSLCTCLKMCHMPYVVFKDYVFVGGEMIYKIYIDKGDRTWEQVKNEVNRVHTTKFNYEFGMCIVNKKFHF